jgi:hypothetical protein
MSGKLSLLTEIKERRDRLKEQHFQALKRLQAAIEAGNHADEGHYRGLEFGLDYGLIHLDFLYDLAKKGEG